MKAPFVTNQLPGRTLITPTAEYLYFSGTSYLGMARNEAFRENLLACLADYGTNYSSSRLSNVQLKVFAEAEDYLAAWTGAEAALTVSSGLVAGQLVVKMLAAAGTFLYGPRAHPALWRQPADLTAEDYSAWSRHLPDQVRAATGETVIIVTNSLDVLWAQPYDFGWLKRLPAHKNCLVLIDDSHGLGVTGPDGGGIYTQLVDRPENVQVVVVSSLGKGLGIPGGVVLCSRLFKEQLQKQAFFGGGSPPAPAYLAAFLRSAALYRQARARLKQNISSFTAALHQPHLFQYFSDYPVFYTRRATLYEFLLRRQVLLSHFPYPSPADPPITRVILNALHTPADLDFLARQINAFSLTES